MRTQQSVRLKHVKLLNFAGLSNKEKEVIRRWRNSPSVRRHVYQNHIISPQEHNIFMKGLKKDKRNVYWLVKDGRKYVGVVSLNRVDFKNRNAYLGIYSNPEKRMTGAGRILINALIEVAFGSFRLHTLKLEVISNNARAVQFYRKAGFKQEGRLREFVSKHRAWLDVIIMGMTRRRHS